MELIVAVVGIVGVVVAILANTTNIVRFTQEQRARRRQVRTDQQGAQAQLQPQSPPLAAGPRILTPDQRLRVFVSSTLQELAEEREAAREAIVRMGLAPVMFELGARPHPPRKLYRAYLEQSHVFVGIYWQRYGWIAPDETVSGLEDEYGLARDHPKLIYLKTPAEREPRLKQLIHRIQEDDHASYRPFRTAAELRELLANDLALLLSERFAGTEVPPPAPVVPAAGETELPRPATPLVGREREVGAVRELLLRDDVRLVTLYGPGGVGKTRLALAVAESVREAFTEGVRFVPLESLQDAALVATAIAQAMALREAGEASPREILKAFLHDKRILLILDNLEHLPAAFALVGSLLAAAPGLEVLATSRTLLHLSGEHAFQVPPLALPSCGALPPEAIGSSDAVRLFLERARAIRPDFELGEANAPAVAAICRRLDGLPLAIELAVARLRLLTPAMLLERLQRSLELLTEGSRDAPGRQQTLRATLDWSFGLLAPAEQHLLGALGVFSGGFTLEAAEAVCAHPDGSTVLDGLSALVDGNLLRCRATGKEERFEMLAVVREYALEKLAAGGEAEAMRQRHADHFLQQAEAFTRDRNRPGQPDRYDRLEQEHDNFRAALAWLLERGRAEEVRRLAVALRWFWEAHSYFSEGRRWLEAALALEGEVAPAVQARTLNAAGVMIWRQGDLSRARPLFEEGLRLRRTLGDQADIAGSLRNLGNLVFDLGDYDTSRTHHLESLRIHQALDDDLEVAASQLNLGNTLWQQGDAEGAGHLWETCRELAAQGGGLQLLAYALGNLGHTAEREGAYQKAEARLEEALQLHRQLGDREGVANALVWLAPVAQAQGDFATARDRLEESLALYREIGREAGVARSLAELGLLARNGEDAEKARALLNESLEKSRALGDELGAARALLGLARLDIDQGTFAAAEGKLQQNLRTCQATGDQRALAAALLVQGDLRAGQERFEEAATSLREGLALLHALGQKPQLIPPLESLATVWRAQGQALGATHLLAAATAARKALGLARTPLEARRHRRECGLLQQVLAGHRYARAWREGGGLTLQQAVASALSDRGAKEVVA